MRMISFVGNEATWHTFTSLVKLQRLHVGEALEPLLLRYIEEVTAAVNQQTPAERKQEASQ